MNKYILVAFAVMGVGFYELSGGSDFEPGSNSLVVFADPKPVPPRREPQPVAVTRANIQPAELTEIAPVRAPVESGNATVLAGLPLAAVDPDPVAQDTPGTADESAAAPEIALPEPEPEPVRDLRFVDGDRVNMRGGPGTNFAVVGKLFRDDMVEVLKDEGNGWLHLRVSATGDEGWMADWLVTAAN
ncbi:SH3 domain-containing protein [Marivita sp. S6314]|uniref:SH3 domain-containing protein n=1 Tax=Marivita sp. S6314 TaxID=2926406 RepID=UPI001FF5A7BA|nr:SH3 domain-containing protein [Marivita sp. S6314]MCK0150612.1 SH3 domain-containing protein [Marivita sp. S6314]